MTYEYQALVSSITEAKRIVGGLVSQGLNHRVKVDVDPDVKPGHLYYWPIPGPDFMPDTTYKFREVTPSIPMLSEGFYGFMLSPAVHIF